MTTQLLGTTSPRARVPSRIEWWGDALTRIRWHWYMHPALLMLSYVVYLPVTNNYYKGIGIALSFLYVLFEMLFGKSVVRVSRNVLYWFIFSLTIGLTFVIYGIFRNNEGAVFSSMIFCIWPIVYMFYVLRINKLEHIYMVSNILIIGTMAIGITISLSALVAAGFLPKNFDIVWAEGNRVAIYEGYAHASHVSLSTLVFSVPFVSGLLMVGVRDRSILYRYVATIALIIGIIATLIGGRRAGILAMITMPVLGLYLTSLLPNVNGRNYLAKVSKSIIYSISALVVVSILMFYILNWNVFSQIKFINEGFDFSSGQSAGARGEQFGPLLNGFLRSPLIGSGFGATLSEVVRSDRPWEFELQYMLILFTTGIVGFVAYSSGILWVIYKMTEIIRRGGPLGRIAIPFTMGMVGFVLANATNPYLQAYGHLWTIFIPIAIVNIYSLGKAT